MQCLFDVETLELLAHASFEGDRADFNKVIHTNERRLFRRQSVFMYFLCGLSRPMTHPVPSQLLKGSLSSRYVCRFRFAKDRVC